MQIVSWSEWMKIKYKLTFKLGPKVVAEVEGREMDADAVRVGDILKAEECIERVTGLRLHVEQIS